MTGDRDDVQDQVDVDEHEALERIARERWGDQWTIRVNHYADGTTRRYAMHSDGRLRPDEHNFDDDARVLEQERIWVDVDEQRMYRDRVHIRKEFETLEDELVESGEFDIELAADQDGDELQEFVDRAETGEFGFTDSGLEATVRIARAMLEDHDHNVDRLED